MPRPVPALLLAFCVVLGHPAIGFSQTQPAREPADPAKLALIREVIVATRASEQAVLAMETALPAQRAANPRIPAVFWDRFAARLRAHPDEFVEHMVPVYDKLFSTGELRDLLKFYRSPLGKRLLEIQPDLTRESMIAGREWGMRVGAEIGRELAAEGVQIQQ